MTLSFLTSKYASTHFEMKKKNERFSFQRKCATVKLWQVEHENFVSNELKNFLHKKKTKLTFRQSPSGFNSFEVFMPEMPLINLFEPNSPGNFAAPVSSVQITK